jgi:hypothetical protein
MAVSLVMHVHHQAEQAIIRWPLVKLFTYARIAATMTRIKFD